MFTMNEDLSIYATRGDVVFFSVTADDNGIRYKFQPGDIVRMAIYGKKEAESCVMQKDFPVTEVTEKVFIYLDEEDTKIGEIISKHKDYWYEIVLNPDTIPQTIIGYDEDGAKVFRLFPESNEIDDNYNPQPEDFPVVDEELDMTSPRPVSNRAIARKLASIYGSCEKAFDAVAKKFVTPEMFGAIGDGVADDSEAIQLALSCGIPVMFDNKTYLCKDVITKNVTDIVMIGKADTVIRWNIDTTEGFRPYCGMISDDDYETTPYLRKGSVRIENITFDGNGANILSFPVEDAFGLCVFLARDNVVVENCTFRNCHCDGLMVRGLRKALTVKNTRFESLGLFQPTNGTRNGITVTRTYWDRAEENTLKVDTPLHVVIENCSFEKIGDECCRADGITNLSLRNCHFKEIGQHVLETGHLTDTTEYMHEIINCVGDKITSSVYNSGADGGGEFPYRGKITVMSCEFKSMAWTGSTAKLTRTPRAALVEGFTVGYKPDVYLDNCRFSSGVAEAELAYESSGYFLCGERVVAKNCYFDYAHINMAQVFPCYALLIMEHCEFNLPSISSDYFTLMNQNNGKVRFIGCIFSHESIYKQIICRCSGASIVFEKNRLNCSGYCFVDFKTTTKNEVRFLNNTFHKTMTGRLVHSDTEGQSAKTVFVFGNDIPENFCGWGKLSNVDAELYVCAFNTHLNVS